MLQNGLHSSARSLAAVFQHGKEETYILQRHDGGRSACGAVKPQQAMQKLHMRRVVDPDKQKCLVRWPAR